MKINARETVILADDYNGVVAWYKQMLGFVETAVFADGFHYSNLATDSGIRLGIAPAAEMGVEVGERKKSGVILQFEVPDLPVFFAELKQKGGVIAFGPTLNEKEGYWFGAIYDLEGNPIWIVDENCP